MDALAYAFATLIGLSEPPLADAAAIDAGHGISEDTVNRVIERNIYALNLAGAVVFCKEEKLQSRLGERFILARD